MSQILESPHLGLRREKGANLGEREVGVREVSKTSKKVKISLTKEVLWRGDNPLSTGCRDDTEVTNHRPVLPGHRSLLISTLPLQICSSRRANILISWSLREVFIILSTGASGT